MQVAAKQAQDQQVTGQEPSVGKEPSVGQEPSDGKEPKQKLSHLAIRSGGYVVRREAIGMFIRLFGVVITVRLIGPAQYGIYSGALAFVAVAAIFAQMGVEVYLIRQPGDVGAGDYDRAYTFLLCVSLVVAAGCLAATYVMGGSWLRPVGVVMPLRVLLLSVPFNVLWAPGQAQIERRFGMKEMGWLEIGGDLALYGTAIPLAFLHAGAWSLVAGYIAWQLFLFIGSMAMSHLRPHWDWSTETMTSLARHGSAFSAGQWAQRLNGTVNAMVVGTFAGATGVGIVAFSLRLVDTIGFAARGAYRLGLVAMSKVPDDHTKRLRFAIEEGTILQILALGVPFAAFGVAAPWLIPALFGHEWSRAINCYSILALATVLNAPSVILGTFLLSRGRNVQTFLAAIVSVVVLTATAIPLVHWLGVTGFAWASVLALVDTVLLDLLVRRTAHFSYRMIGAFAAVLAPPILFPLLAMPYALVALSPMLLLLAIKPLRAESIRITKVVRSSFARGMTS